MENFNFRAVVFYGFCMFVNKYYAKVTGIQLENS